MTRVLLAALAALAASGCTLDLHLGARETSCDPFAEACACTTTADCPAHYHCMPVSNTAAFCEPPAGCTAIAMGGLDCPAAACNPATDTTCDPAPACMANTCASPAETCCAARLACFPTTCLGCCA